jgi:hypothetical protein
MADPTLAPSRRERLRRLFVEYGALGFAVHYTIYLLVFVSFVLAIRHKGAAAEAAGRVGVFGVWAAAYLATKLALPIRLLGTLTLTPLIRSVWRRVRRPAPPVREADSSSAPAALPAITVVEPAQRDDAKH